MIPCSDAVDTSSDMSISAEDSDSDHYEDVMDGDDSHDATMEHENGDGDNIMQDTDADWEDISTLGSDADNAEDDLDGGVEYSEEDDEINMKAYDTENVDNNGLYMTEQAGVIHLVHGWTQRGHPDQVGCDPASCLRC